MKRILSFVASIFLAGVCLAQTFPPSPSSNLSRVAGRFVASNYAYGSGSSMGGKVSVGNSTTGSVTITVEAGYIVLPDGRQILPFSVTAPILVGLGTVQETVTPTAVSGCTTAAASGVATCSITGTFNQLHSHGELVSSGTFGLQEAINDAQNSGGGVVTVDQQWILFGGTDTIIAAATPFANVTVEDASGPEVEFWNPGPTTATFIATPTALVAASTVVAATSPAGSYANSAYVVCVSYVDIVGNEGACSTTATITPASASSSLTFTAPVASTGAIGYTIYVSLAGGTYALSYQVPLSSTVCTLTKLESVTPACAIANATYNQSASNAVVTAITTNTAPLALQLGVASTTADYVGNSNAHTIYSYISSAHSGATGIMTVSLPFTAGPATVASTVPQVIGTIAIPPNFMNQVGKTVRVCGKEQMTNASATVEQIQLWWDGAGSNAAGVPVNIANIQVAGTGTAVAYNGNFCETFTTTVSGAGATAGSILGGNSAFYLGIASAPVASFSSGTDTFTAATASLNLAGGGGFTTRLHVVQLHTTGTDVSPKLVNLTVEVL